MAVVLRSGNQTSLTVSGWNSGIIEGADGVRETVVELPETGEYTIQIGTDATASYTLQVTINPKLRVGRNFGKKEAGQRKYRKKRIEKYWVSVNSFRHPKAIIFPFVSFVGPVLSL